MRILQAQHKLLRTQVAVNVAKRVQIVNGLERLHAQTSGIRLAEVTALQDDRTKLIEIVVAQRRDHVVERLWNSALRDKSVKMSIESLLMLHCVHENKHITLKRK